MKENKDKNNSLERVSQTEVHKEVSGVPRDENA